MLRVIHTIVDDLGLPKDHFLKVLCHYLQLCLRCKGVTKPNKRVTERQTERQRDWQTLLEFDIDIVSWTNSCYLEWIDYSITTIFKPPPVGHSIVTVAIPYHYWQHLKILPHQNKFIIGFYDQLAQEP